MQIADAEDLILVLTYADDFKFFCRVNSVEGRASLQRALDTLLIWCV